MSLDKNNIGFSLPKFQVEVEAENLKNFNLSIGLPANKDSNVAPLTFMKVLEGQGNSSRVIMESLGAELHRILHAEQQFDYISPIVAGDVVTVERKVIDIYDKKNGELSFVVIESTFTSAVDNLLGRSRQIVLVRNKKK